MKGRTNHRGLKKNRLIVLENANYLCEKWGDTAIQVHHKDKSRNNHAIDNLRALCILCHKEVHCNYGRMHLRKAIREKFNTKYAFAKHLNIRYQYVALVAAGIFTIEFKDMVLWAKVLGKPVDGLFKRDKINPMPPNRKRRAKKRRTIRTKPEEIEAESRQINYKYFSVFL